MNRQVERIQVLVDGRLEKELHLIQQEKDSVRVLGDGLLGSGNYSYSLDNLRKVATRRAIIYFGEDKGQLEIKAEAYSGE